MTNLVARAKPAVEELASLSEDQLYTELGTRLKSISRGPDGSDRFDMVAGETLESYGPLTELKSLGQKFFARWSRAAYALLCGTGAEDAAARTEAANAFGLGREQVVATIAVLLAAHLGLAAGLAAVVASLAVRLFFQPSREAMCDYWAERLPAVPT